MAYVTTSTSTGTAPKLPAFFRTGLGLVRTQINARKARSRMRWELNQYSDRELADMGLSRADIDGIAASVRIN